MRKMMLAVTLLLIIVTVYGCSKYAASGAEDSVKAMGRYMEDACVMPLNKNTGTPVEHPTSIAKTKDGQLKMSAADGNRMLFFESSDNGKNWNTMEPVTQKYTEYDNDVLFTYSPPVWLPDGSLLFEKYEAVSDDYVVLTYIQMDSEGNTKKLILDLPELDDDRIPGFTFFDGKRLKGNYLSSLQIDQEGYLYGIDFMRHILKFDLSTGKQLKNFDFDNIYVDSYTLAGNVLIIYDGGQHLWYDKDSGKSFGDQPLLRSKLLEGDSPYDYDYISFSAGQEKNEIFLYVDSCIYRYTMDGSVIELVVDGSFNSLSDPRMQLYWFSFDGDGEFTALCMNDVKFQLSRFIYDPDVPTVPDKELSVYALSNSEYVSQVIALYRKKHPDTYVRLELGIANEVTDAETALQKLHEQLENGGGPDILFLDGMDCCSYGLDDYLADIRSVVCEKAEAGQFLENILQLNDSGPVYTIPTRFSLYVCIGEAEEVKKAGELVELADTAGSPDEEVIDPHEGLQYADLGMAYSVKEILEGKKRLSYVKVSNMISFSYIWTSEKVYRNFSYKILPVFSPEGHIGMNRNSARIGDAELFVKEMLSEDVQALRTGGFPVAEAAFEQVSRQPVGYEENFYSMDVIIDEKLKVVVISWPDRASCKDMLVIAKSASEILSPTDQEPQK